MIVKKIHDFRKRMEAQTEKISKKKKKFNKELEVLKNKQTYMNTTISEMKTTLEGIISRITEEKE